MSSVHAQRLPCRHELSSAFRLFAAVSPAEPVSRSGARACGPRTFREGHPGFRSRRRRQSTAEGRDAVRWRVKHPPLESLPNVSSKTPVLNRGFGGSQISDVVHFADRIVIKYQPKQIYLNSGGNDLHSGRTPEEVLAAFEAFAAKVHKDLPKTKLAFISIPTAPSRWDEVELVQKTNSLISDFCAKNGVDFIDIFPRLLGSDGKPRPELYVEDKLHFSEAGYDVVTSAIKWQKEIFAFAKQDAENAPPANPSSSPAAPAFACWKITRG
jgi:lysophospholipase L1-like esterase